MKTRMTRNDVNTNYAISVGYCKAQWLLTDVDALGFNAGIYGWNWDAYNVDGCTVVTGCRNFPAGIRKANYVNEYNAMAREALDNNDYTALEEIRSAWIQAEMGW